MTSASIGPIGPAAPTIPTFVPARRGNAELGKDDFLRLLITQLRYQDPTNPSKPEEFAAQLAQFTSLERMQNIERLLEDTGAASALATLALKADLGASFIGRNVLAAGNSFEVGPEGGGRVHADIGPGGGKATLTIYDETGREVASREVGFRGAGRQVIDAPDLPAGTYTYRLEVQALSGADVPVQTYSSGIIDGVSFQGGQVLLRSGNITFPLDNVVEVERAPAGAAALAAATGARILSQE